MREKVAALLAARDRSALVLSKYVPAQRLDGWLALRGVAVETAKIADSGSDPKAALARLGYWHDTLKQFDRVAPARRAQLPDSLQLLGEALDAGSQIHRRYLLTLLETRQKQVVQPPINDVVDLARLGEGSYSQILYATLDMLQQLEPGSAEWFRDHPELDELASEILAHVGQAAGIAGSLRAARFYATTKNRVMLPADVLRHHNVPHQEVIAQLTSTGPAADRALQAALQDAVFDVATAANDHILTARQKMQRFRETVGRTPPSLDTAAMAAIPVVLYLERLEKNQFDVRRSVTEWKLPWRSWRGRSGRF